MNDPSPPSRGRSALTAFLDDARIERLANGLTVCLLENRQAPLVTTALWYRVGSRDETAAEAGSAHFLEHMMFKGSPGYGPGEIDRRTQALGGSNNAFTTRDVTAYYFDFARECWAEGLAIEADRMAELTLEPREVDSERQVILEEVSMYESEPWDALDMATQAALFPEHPYGRPILGTREALAATGADDLRSFHRRHYRPDNAVLVVAGDLEGSALERIEAAFARVPTGTAPRPELAAPTRLSGLTRVERRMGEVPRMQLLIPAPPARDPDFPLLRSLVTLLVGGRSSRLHRALVDEAETCQWVQGDLSESTTMGVLSFGLELVPGAEPEAVEAELLGQLERIAGEPLGEEELARVQRIQAADWVFSHERIHQQALTAGFALSLFDLDHMRWSLEASLEATAADLQRVAARYVDPRQGGVLGWSLPRANGRRGSSPATGAARGKA